MNEGQEGLEDARMNGNRTESAAQHGRRVLSGYEGQDNLRR
jgi:hypothetical protein